MSRLSTHASGRRSGGKFCIYVCDRLVLSTLTDAERAEVSAGRLSLDAKTRDSIRGPFFFQYVTVDSIEAARKLEDEVKKGALGTRSHPVPEADLTTSGARGSGSQTPRLPDQLRGEPGASTTTGRKPSRVPQPGAVLDGG